MITPLGGSTPHLIKPHGSKQEYARYNDYHLLHTLSLSLSLSLSPPPVLLMLMKEGMP